MTQTVVLGRLPRDATWRRAVRSVMETAGLGRNLARGDAIFLKPNLTYPTPKPGVTTRAEFVETAAQYFLDQGCRVTIGEGPGGYKGFSMKAAFDAHGLTAVARKVDAELADLSDWEAEGLEVSVGSRRTVIVPMPKRLLRDYSAIVSLPVPKVHCATGVSLGLKNLWGCIPDTFRIRFHPWFDQILAGLSATLPVRGCVLDGLYGLDENGPMIDGVARRLDWIAASSDVGAHDVLITRLMGFDPAAISHLRHALDRGVIPPLSEIAVQGTQVEQQQFTLRLNLWNRAAKLTWFHPSLTWLVYLSPFAGPLHGLMYAVRPRPKDLAVRSFRGWEEGRGEKT